MDRRTDKLQLDSCPVATMTVKEVAEVLGVHPETIKVKIRELYPELMRTGVTTRLNEAQVTNIKLHLNSLQGEPTKKFVGVTNLEKQQTIALALQYAQDLIVELQVQNERLQIELGQSKEWYSVKRVLIESGRKFSWKPLKQYSEENGYEVKKVFDQNYGEVNAYHIDVWNKVYGVEL